MGVGTVKKSPSKENRSPIATRNSTSKAIKAQNMGTPETPSRSSRARSTPREGYTHHLPTPAERRNNGRVTGRSLIVWGRPRMAEKLLLHIQYECARHKISLPWDAIAHRLHPGSSGAAIMQHLNRLRKELISEGHLVPPVPQRPGHGETPSAEIRGFIREDMDGDDLHTTRSVRFDEEVEDRRFNLPSVFNLEEAYEDDAQDEDQWLASPTPMSRSQGRTHQRMNSAGQRIVQPTRPDPAVAVGMTQAQHDALQSFITENPIQNVSPTGSGSSPDDGPGSEQDCVTSPSVRRQRKQNGHGNHLPMMNPYAAFPYPHVALPHQTLAPEFQAMAATTTGTNTSPIRQQGYFDGNIAPWALDGSTERPHHPIMNPYGFALPTGYGPVQYPSPSLANAAIPMTQQGSQGTNHSFSTLSSGDDSQANESGPDVNTQAPIMGNDNNGFDDIFDSQHEQALL